MCSYNGGPLWQVMLQDPAELADAFAMIHEQKRTAWSHVFWWQFFFFDGNTSPRS